jgi:hypothetical protein
MVDNRKSPKAKNDHDNSLSFDDLKFYGRFNFGEETIENLRELLIIDILVSSLETRLAEAKFAVQGFLGNNRAVLKLRPVHAASCP